MTTKTYTVSLDKLIREFNLEKVYLPKLPQEILISTADVNRPGLQLVGYFDFFDYQRVQILGKSEFAYMERLPQEELECCLEKFFSHKPPVIVITRGLEPFACMLELAKKALQEESQELATSVFAKDNLLDEINAEVTAILADYIVKHPESALTCLNLISVFRKLERSGDHITNIAEEIVFFIDAKVLKHSGRTDENYPR